MAADDRVSAEQAAPSLIWLGRKGASHAHDVAWYERRHGEPVPEGMREAASEVAPGIWVKLMSTGGHYCEKFRGETWGGLAAVWDERALTGEDGSGVSEKFKRGTAELMDRNDGLLRRLATTEDDPDV